VAQLFDFRCTTCEHVFEGWDTIEKNAKPLCPKCSSPDTGRLISTPRFDYKSMVASGHSSDDGMTTSIDRWAKARAQKVAIETRNMERHGTVD
jgi:putative FmdB family regulatory protein